MSIKVVINGALGKMGQELVKAVQNENDLHLVGLVDVREFPEYYKGLDLEIGQDIDSVLLNTQAHVMVDFTQPDVLMSNITIALKNKVTPIVGTTGITEEDLDEIHKISKENGVGVIIVPNFSIGAVLMMHYAAKISPHMPNVEIIELHHDKKIDAPSGTAIKTSQLINKELNNFKEDRVEKDMARGGVFNGINIHSVRLPGLVAHQEVIFGGLGQTLSLRHDTTSREAFMPGVILAIREARNLKGVVYGLEKILGL